MARVTLKQSKTAKSKPSSTTCNLQFTRRNIVLTPDLFAKVSTEEQQVLDEIQETRARYFAGQAEHSRDALQLEMAVRKLPESDAKPAIWLAAADTELLLTQYFFASNLVRHLRNDRTLGEESPIRAIACLFLGDISRGKRSYSWATLLYTEALDIWKRLSMPHACAVAMADIARLHIAEGNYVEGIRLIKEAIETASTSANPDAIAYCRLTQIEILTGIRDNNAAGEAMKQFAHTVGFSSNFRNTPTQLMVLADFEIATHEYDEAMDTLGSLYKGLVKLGKHEMLPDIVLRVAGFAIEATEYKAAFEVLKNGIPNPSSLVPYRFDVFLPYLECLRTALVGIERIDDADRIQAGIEQMQKFSEPFVRESIYARNAWWTDSDRLQRVLGDVYGVVATWYAYGKLRFNLTEGLIFRENGIEPIHSLKPEQAKVVRAMASEPGKYFKNRDIVRALNKYLAEGDSVPRRDGYYMKTLRELFVELGGDPIIETGPRGEGYRFPKT